MTPPRQLVVDASVIIELVAQGPRAKGVHGLLRDHHLSAPTTIDSEVLNALKGLERGGALSAAAASRSVGRLERTAVELHPLGPLVPSAWKLRHQLSIYDAMYVALAGRLRCPVVTLDRRWQRVGDLGAPIITLA